MGCASDKSRRNNVTKKGKRMKVSCAHFFSDMAEMPEAAAGRSAKISRRLGERGIQRIDCMI